MLLGEIVSVLEEIAPCRLAEEWDNVGLLAGDPEQSVRRALLTIDLTRAVLDEAEREGCQLVVSYHPPIWKPLKRVLAGSVVYEALRRGIALYSPHTALDVAEGGTNDVLADVLRLIERTPLRVSPARASEYLLVTFVPSAESEAVARALMEAGAGRAGEGDEARMGYRAAEARLHRATAATEERDVGASGQWPAPGEVRSEVRLEMTVPIARVEAVLGALREAHPDDEPTWDLVQLASPPGGLGLGRIGTLATPMDRRALIDEIKAELGVTKLLVAGPMDGLVRRAAVGAGAGGELIEDALAQHADLYLTGELRHHDALLAAERGMTVVCALHSNSERVSLRHLKLRLEEKRSELEVLVSQSDHDPFQIV